MHQEQLLSYALSAGTCLFHSTHSQERKLLKRKIEKARRSQGRMFARTISGELHSDYTSARSAHSCAYNGSERVVDQQKVCSWSEAKASSRNTTKRSGEKNKRETGHLSSPIGATQHLGLLSNVENNEVTMIAGSWREPRKGEGTQGSFDGVALLRASVGNRRALMERSQLS